MPKPERVGCPKVARGEAKGKIVPIRFNAEDLKNVTAEIKSGHYRIVVRLPCRPDDLVSN
jgi:hypothetical protein